MAYIILGAHGLANKPPANVLMGYCKAALLEGLARNCGNTEQKIEYKGIYWVDVRNSTPLDPDDEPYLPAGGSGPLKTYKDGWWSGVVARVLSVEGDTLDGAKRYVGMDLVADAVLKAKLDDLAVYYKDQEIRDELRARLKLELLNVPATTRIMLIAHSMGTIIANDVLRDIGRDNPDFQIDHLITIGAPLGLPHVKNKIYHENHLVRTPTVVQRWTNFADRRDPVAFDVHLSDDYAPNDRGVQVKDDLVINNYTSPAGKANHHKMYGYLRAPELSEVVRSFL